MIVYERDGLWFWTCPSCHWLEGAYARPQDARKDSKKHACGERGFAS